MPDSLTTDLITGQTQEDIERTMRDGFIAIRDEAGHLLMRYNPERNIIEIQRRRNKTSIDLNQYQQRSATSATVTGGDDGRFPNN